MPKERGYVSVGKKSRNNPRRFGFRAEMRRRALQPVLRLPFRFSARAGDALAERAVSILAEAGYGVGSEDGLNGGGERACVLLATSPVAQRGTTRLAVYACPWRKWKHGPLVILLREKSRGGFENAILCAAARYTAWGIQKGQLAPFPICFHRLTEEKRLAFEAWRRSVGDVVGIPSHETNVLIENLRASLTNRSVRNRRRKAAPTRAPLPSS